MDQKLWSTPYLSLYSLAAFGQLPALLQLTSYVITSTSPLMILLPPSSSTLSSSIPSVDTPIEVARPHV